MRNWMGQVIRMDLKTSKLSTQARMMALADIFEALTAKDRHIDPESLEIFIKEAIYFKYATKYIDSSQINEVEVKCDT